MGGTGTGKTRTALEETENSILTSIVPYKYKLTVSLYNEEEDVILDDFLPNNIETCKYVKTLCKNSKMLINRKFWKCKRLYITSNSNPLRWWKGEKDWVSCITSIRYMG